MRNVQALRPRGISVVIPTLDRLDLLKRAYDSVSSSQPNRVEIVIVDDGSPQDIRLHLPTSNQHGIAIRAFRFVRNRGPQAARNLGIRRARFSHIAFLDSDDAFSSQKLDVVLSELDRTDFDLMYHGVAGMPKYSRIARLWHTYLVRLIPFEWWIALLNPIATPALVVRRNGRLGNIRMRHCEDWAYLLRYCEPGIKVHFVDQELSTVFRSPGSSGGLSAAIWRMRKGEFVARQVLWKAGWPSGPSRIAIGGIVGSIRILNDLLRGRYFR